MNAGGSLVHKYELFGLGLRSAIMLPELQPCPHDKPEPVEISLGDVWVADGEPQGLIASPGGVTLTIARVARFHISNGRKIVVHPDAAASERNVRLFLLGSAMGMLLHQRRLLPLHANAIEIGGGAVAFMGKSGAGKSTLAAAFHERGHCILSDDVCVLSPEGERFVAQAGIPRLRLWRDAIERMGRNVDDYECAFDSLDKYTVGIGSAACCAASPIRAIFLLVQGDGSAIEIRRLSGVAAVKALIDNTYRGSFIPRFGDPSAHFATCIALSRKVPVFTLSRPWDVGAIDATIAHIDDHLRSEG